MMVFVWLGLFIVTLFVEIAVPALVSIWFAAGSFAALILAAFLGDQLIWLQILVFIIVSISTIILLRPLVFKNRKNEIRTNVDSLVGKIGTVDEAIRRFYPGTVKIQGLTWAAQVDDSFEDVLEKDTLVKVEEVNGNKLKVIKYTED